jgi:hypothetical protein
MRRFRKSGIVVADVVLTTSQTVRTIGPLLAIAHSETAPEIVNKHYFINTEKNHSMKSLIENKMLFSNKII